MNKNRNGKVLHETTHVWVTIMFVTLEKIAAQDPKYADILLLENYAAFQNSVYIFILPLASVLLHQMMSPNGNPIPKALDGHQSLEDFLNCLYDLANVVPTLAKFYHQASENYELACTRHISMIIYYQFERLFQFARRIEDFMYTLAPEETATLHLSGLFSKDIVVPHLVFLKF
ncbi:hypothetical protein TEA_007618 [Camellia sinensis var. sinensis]|uniref:Uncharacterized protein n=1 Tax=Camellia sinensis var. sinensis TaxID=542762 RepID=A0A4S4CYE9_CAMSN|nr:hypothetical protein TEA_007618 [Camellia sinensis var. sinensis]